MSESDHLTSAANLLERAILQMKALHIPSTPENVTVWFYHFEGSRPQLTREINKLLNRDIAFTDTLSKQLYDTYFIDSDRLQLDILREAITDLIQQLSMRVMSGFSDELDAYDTALHDCEERLNKVPNAEELRMLVGLLSEASEKARQSTSSAQGTISKMQAELDELKTAFNELEKHAMEDPLTGVANRRAFDQIFRESLFECETAKGNCCLLLVDIDEFKKFNDLHGHLIGDKVLRFVSLMLRKLIKGADLLARYGGEEFAIILPDTEYDGGISVATGIVSKIGKTRLTITEEAKPLDPITVSIGVASYHEGDTPETLFRRADTALYKAKNSGRNQAVGDHQIDA